MSRLFYSILAFMLAGTIVATTQAADLGIDGEVWPITEPDLIESIHAELARAENDGRLARFNENLADQGRKALFSPPSLPLPKAHRDRDWVHDPTIVVRRDIHTHQGVLIAARGTRINPLSTVALDKPLLFVDGTDAAQLAWAFAQDGKVILISGNPKELMDTHDRRLFYDQRGVLTSRFNIKAVPASVSQEGLILRVREVLLDSTHPEIEETGGNNG